MHRLTLTIMACLLSCLALTAQEERERFVSDLMAKMTVEEKIGQLNLMPGSSFSTGEQ